MWTPEVLKKRSASNTDSPRKKMDVKGWWKRSMSVQSAPMSPPASTTPQPKAKTYRNTADGRGCLPDYSHVSVEDDKSLEYAWKHVQLLATEERVFSAAILLDRIESYVEQTQSTTAQDTVSIRTVEAEMSQKEETLINIKKRRDAGVVAMEDFNGDDTEAGWQLGQTYAGVSTYWKPGDSGTVWLKLDGMVEGVDIFNTLAVVRETDLFHLWVPLCSTAQLLQLRSYVEVITYIGLSLPMMPRDALIHAYGINACFECGCILLLGGSVDDSKLDDHIKVPKMKGWGGDRAEIRGFRALIEPMTRTSSRTCIVTNLDLKCAIPKSMINYGIKKVAGILLYLLRREAEKIEKAQQDQSRNEHLRRIESDPSGFYSWIRPLLDVWFVAKNNGMSPPQLSIDTLRGNSSSYIQSSDERDSISLREAKIKTEEEEIQQLGLLYRWTQRLQSTILWPYLLLLVFIGVDEHTWVWDICIRKLFFTCACTWLAVPPVLAHDQHHTYADFVSIRRKALVFAAVWDILTSWFARMWAHYLVCFARNFFQGVTTCWQRTNAEVTDTEQFTLLTGAVLYASVVVAVLIATKPRK